MVLQAGQKLLTGVVLFQNAVTACILLNGHDMSSLVPDKQLIFCLQPEQKGCSVHGVGGNSRLTVRCLVAGCTAGCLCCHLLYFHILTPKVPGSKVCLLLRFSIFINCCRLYCICGTWLQSTSTYLTLGIPRKGGRLICKACAGYVGWSVWLGRSKWLLSCSLYIPYLTIPCFAYTLLT